jgi:hypothetical protein
MQKRKAVMKVKGDWIAWLQANCPDISDRTDRLYRRLAKKEKEIKAAAENGNTVAEFSIRGAARLIAKPRPPRPPKPPEPAPEPSPPQDIHTVLKILEPEHLHASRRIGTSRRSKNSAT